jgi:hypothetical protein
MWWKIIQVIICKWNKNKRLKINKLVNQINLYLNNKNQNRKLDNNNNNSNNKNNNNNKMKMKIIIKRQEIYKFLKKLNAGFTQ